MSNSFIIIIGNGDCVSKLKLGNIIDSYETVVRINNYKIDGFEEYIGTKTNVWSTYGGLDVLKRDTANIDTILVINKAIDLDINKLDSSKCIFKNVNVFDILKNNEILVDEFIPSTGLCTVLYYVNTYKIPIVYYGFDFFKSGHYFNKKHIFWSYHNSNLEEFIFKELTRKKLILPL